MKLLVDAKMQKRIKNYGFEISQGRNFIGQDILIETPTNVTANLGSNVKLGAFSYGGNNLISNVEIGRYSSISADVRIFPKSNHPSNWLSSSPFQYDDCFGWWKFFKVKSRTVNNPDADIKKTIIGNDVWIGNNVFINSGVKIGDGAIIGMNATITKDVPPYAIVINRNEIKGYRFDQKIIEQLQALQWWKYNFTQFDAIQWDNVKTAIDQIKEKIKDLQPYSPNMLDYDKLKNLCSRKVKLFWKK